jgi:hypothetical protein
VTEIEKLKEDYNLREINEYGKKNTVLDFIFGD